jgi:hypothetical protein
MPRKDLTEIKEKPNYISADGTLNFSKIFTFQTKQTELLRNVSRNGKVYLQPAASQCLSVGGIRGGKTLGWLMFAAMRYCLSFKGCDILVLRRTFKELEAGAITDSRTFLPKELFTYDATRHVLTFTNGSRIIFGHCANNLERDLAQYLGRAYSFILIDECGQFSPDAWMMLLSRNTVNAGCEPDEYGNLPIPCMVGCTNPLGPHYDYYKTLFVEHEPWMKPEGAKKATDGSWWVQEAGDWRLIYDPKSYACQRSTVMDNAELLKRDPGIIARLNSMPKAKRDKMLLGLDGLTEGQFFDCWDPWYHVINLREDPDAIIWQEHQDVWIGSDWGMQHANASYFFTKALVKVSIGADYRLKTVCFAEVVTTGGKTMRELASLLANKLHLPNGKPIKIKHIYFSHEKFNRVMEGFGHTPADEYSKVLRDFGMPPVTPATRDRIASASYMYNMIKGGDLVVLDVCKDLIFAMPSLMRDPKNLDDVLKVDSKSDDVYDAVRYGLFGEAPNRKKSDSLTIRDQVTELAKTDPFAAHFYKLKKEAELKNKTVCFKPREQPVWQSKLDNQ